MSDNFLELSSSLTSQYSPTYNSIRGKGYDDDDEDDDDYESTISISSDNDQGSIEPVKIKKKKLDSMWMSHVCDEIPGDNVCHHVFVVKSKKVTFCSAAKVASTTTKQYFYDIADGEIEMPEGARYGIHEAQWKRLGSMEQGAISYILRDKNWTHVFFWKHVVERFVSGYLDKVVKVCEKKKEIESHMVLHYYVQYGFSCEKHSDIDGFVSFIETVPKIEGHFAPQTPLCSVQKFPFTDIIRVDENFSSNLKKLSAKLRVKHPTEKESTSTHKTGAKDKMVDIFKGKPKLVRRILKLFEVDCVNIPEACDVQDLMAAI
eukprot:CAMPEP_0203688042 /NCGR_PEP_ID=MMETSP0091-20130426/894_1 /ASSEMBLY_ACC=CAM_ASM_001089 /TAXON_ID=426623 /ORGANISM="Chaetoceros affinis, Strain CCMP159" /LENGTH=317 /DNA_ID=CAMNT_0050557493 /DNA_START=135 /DNA_END=1088 /DNA_ORIENTATION=-